MENTVEKLGEKITRLRNAKGWSQETLAAESGVGRRTVQNIESGTTESPGIDSVIDLAHALGVSISSLIDDKPLRAELILEIHSLLMQLNEDDLETIKTTAEGLKTLSQTKKKSKTAE